MVSKSRSNLENVFSKCPRHCAFVSMSNAHENAHLLGFALNKLGSSSNEIYAICLAGTRTATARGPSAF